MKNSLKIFLVTIIGASLLFSGFSFSRLNFYPIETRAVTVVDWVNLAARNALAKVWKVARDTAFATLRIRVINLMVDQIVAWIQGGGKPQFVTDWKGFAYTALKQGIGDAIIDDPTLGFLCSPFRAQLKFTLPLIPIPKFSEEARCTLDDIGLNLKNFREDFRAGLKGGSWIGFHSIWEPQNNMLGAQLIGQYQIFSEQEKTLSAQNLKALTGDGFLGMMDKTGKFITLPGVLAKDLTSQAVTSGLSYVLSARETAEIAAAISNAVFNRIMKGGAVGLANVTIDDKAARDAAIDQLNRDFDRMTKTDLQTIYLNYTTQINQSLLPRQEADEIIEKTINDAKAFLGTDLGAKYAKLKAAVPRRDCPGETEFKFIASNIINTTFAPNLLPNLEKNKEENNQYLELLSPAIEKIKTTYTGRLTNIEKISSIGETFTALENQAKEKNISDKIFDKDLAQEFLANAKATYQDTTAKIEEATTRIENLCPIVIPAS